MTLYEIITTINYVILAVSLVVLGRMIWAGALSEKHLRLGPTRDLNQPIAVYAFAIFGVFTYSTMMVLFSGSQQPELLLAIELSKFMLIGLMIGRARHTEAGFRKIGLVPRWPWRDVRWGFYAGVIGLGLAGSAALLVNFISTRLGHPVDPVAHEALQTLRDEFSTALLLNLIISAVILAPLTEELLFRGVFQTSLLRLFRGARWPALLIAAIVFSLLHWSVVTSWHALVPLFVLGLVWGVLYERTGSLLAPILAHAIFNAANIAMALSLPEQMPQ